MNETLLFLIKKYSTKIEVNQENRNFRWRCNVCKIENCSEYRYKCLICYDYDQCSVCFESRKVNENHQINHPVVRFEIENQVFGLNFNNNEINLQTFVNIFKELSHQNIQCNACHSNVLKGPRFKCDTCIDYDLCFKCYEDKKSVGSHLFSEHPLIFQLDNSALEINSNDIDLLENIGNGCFASVFKAKLKSSNKIVACKICSTDKFDKTFYLNELFAYRELKGVNILKMFGFSSMGEDSLIIITEFMNKGSLKSVLQNEPDLSYRKRLNVVCDIVCGMARSKLN